MDKVTEEEAAVVAEQQVTDRSLYFNIASKLMINVLNPFQKLVFGCFISRTRKTCHVLQGVIEKLILARIDQTVKYSMMENSLGAHGVSGALVSPSVLPYNLHTAFIVQGALNNEWYNAGGKYNSVKQNLVGPVVFSVSQKDHLHGRVFGPFHGDAVRSSGFA